MRLETCHLGFLKQGRGRFFPFLAFLFFSKLALKTASVSPQNCNGFLLQFEDLKTVDFEGSILDTIQLTGASQGAQGLTAVENWLPKPSKNASKSVDFLSGFNRNGNLKKIPCYSILADESNRVKSLTTNEIYEKIRQIRQIR